MIQWEHSQAATRSVQVQLLVAACAQRLHVVSAAAAGAAASRTVVATDEDITILVLQLPVDILLQGRHAERVSSLTSADCGMQQPLMQCRGVAFAVP